MQSLPKQSADWDTPEDHYGALHNAPHGTVIIWHRHARGGSRWPRIHRDDPAPPLLAPHQGGVDRYMSVNQFYQWRSVRLLRSLRACYVDVDGVPDLPSALEALASQQIPAPTHVVYSGFGMHLYWLIEPVRDRALPVWQMIQDRLVRSLAHLGADPKAKDCTRVLRLAGSRHGQNFQEVQGFVLDNQRWPLRLLADEVLGERMSQAEKQRRYRAACERNRERQQEIKAREGEVRDLRAHQNPETSGGIYRRWHLVYQDLVKIAEANWWGGVPEGHRDTWTFLAANALSWFGHPDAILYEIESEAKKWTDLPTNEVRAGIATVVRRAQASANGEKVTWRGKQVDPRYRFRRSTLWEWCEGMIPPEIIPNLRAIIPDEVAQERDRARHRTTGQTRWQYERHSAERQKPWEQLGMSRRTYYRRKKAGKV